jgi:hypothetical protein
MNFELENHIEQYLDKQGTVLWSQTFDLLSTRGRRQAKEFILDLLIDLEFIHSQEEDEAL